MADLDTQRDAELTTEDDYTMGEIVFWVLGILTIPMVPILMIWLLTPYSGM